MNRWLRFLDMLSELINFIKSVIEWTEARDRDDK